MDTREDMPLKQQLFTIPNLMGYFRILLIPVFVIFYVKKDWYLAAAAVIAVSGLTDLFDGFIARKFHMVTKLGKALDPVADKLTQGAMALCLTFRYRLMLPLLLLFVIKEGYMAVMGAVLLRKGRMLDGAKWFGKICTAVLYVVMFVLFLIPSMPNWCSTILIAACMGFLLFSLIMYIPVFIRMHREAKNGGE